MGNFVIPSPSLNSKHIYIIPIPMRHPLTHSPLLFTSFNSHLPLPFSPMATHFIFISISIFFIIFMFSPTIGTKGTGQDLVQSSCLHATFPKVCVHTLSVHRCDATTPRQLALVAVEVSIARASNVSEFLKKLEQPTSKRERGAMKDCATQIADSVDELRKSLGELKQLRRGTFRWQMSNAETWVSAALTNEDTCLDGFKEIGEGVRLDVKRKVTNVAKVTSNALYLINRLDHP